MSTQSGRVKGLRARKSAVNASVTLYEPEDIKEESSRSSSLTPPPPEISVVSPTPRAPKRRLRRESTSSETDDSPAKKRAKNTLTRSPKPASARRRNAKTKAAPKSGDLDIKEEADVPAGAAPRKRVKTVASPRKAKAIQMALAVPHPEPEHWREVYSMIKDMRTRITAPVDTMGCILTPDEVDPKVRAAKSGRLVFF